MAEGCSSRDLFTLDRPRSRENTIARGLYSLPLCIQYKILAHGIVFKHQERSQKHRNVCLINNQVYLDPIKMKAGITHHTQ